MKASVLPLELRPVEADELEGAYSWIERNAIFSKYGMDRVRLAPGLARAAIDPDARLLGAFDSSTGTLVGFAWFLKRGAFGRSGYLRLIAVDPAVAKGGVGRALMSELEREFLAPNGIFLLATHENTHAQEFYTRLGYQKVGEIPDYVVPGLNEVLFYKAAPRI